MPTKIKAAVLYEPNTPLRVQTVTLSDPRAHEVRIALRATGLCHTDFNFISGSATHYLPVVLGHEGFGVVEEVGPGVTSVEVGDTVIPYVVPDCGECELCLSGLTNNCLLYSRDYTRLGDSRLSHNGQPIAGLFGTATFAEQTVVHERQIVKVNPAADPALACCLACGVTTGVGSALKTAGIVKGSTVAVFGLGGVGIGVVQGARLAQASTIVAIDTNLTREAIARDLGATHFLDARSPSLVDDVKAICGRGVQYAFDCVGHRAIIKQALAILDRGLGGVVVGIGVLDPNEDLTITAAELTGATITRSLMGGAKRADVATYVDWLVEGRLHLDQVVSHRISLEEINHGYEMVASGEAVRVVVTFDS